MKSYVEISYSYMMLKMERTFQERKILNVDILKVQGTFFVRFLKIATLEKNSLKKRQTEIFVVFPRFEFKL